MQLCSHAFPDGTTIPARPRRARRALGIIGRPTTSRLISHPCRKEQPNGLGSATSSRQSTTSSGAAMAVHAPRAIMDCTTITSHYLHSRFSIWESAKTRHVTTRAGGPQACPYGSNSHWILRAVTCRSDGAGWEKPYARSRTRNRNRKCDQCDTHFIIEGAHRQGCALNALFVLIRNYPPLKTAS